MSRWLGSVLHGETAAQVNNWGMDESRRSSDRSCFMVPHRGTTQLSKSLAQTSCGEKPDQTGTPELVPL